MEVKLKREEEKLFQSIMECCSSIVYKKNQKNSKRYFQDMDPFYDVKQIYARETIVL